MRLSAEAWTLSDGFPAFLPQMLAENRMLFDEVNEDGQFLRMTFMVEQLLSSIKSCGGVYRPLLARVVLCKRAAWIDFEALSGSSSLMLSSTSSACSSKTRCGHSERRRRSCILFIALCCFSLSSLAVHRQEVDAPLPKLRGVEEPCEAFLSHCRSHGIDHEVFSHWWHGQHRRKSFDLQPRFRPIQLFDVYAVTWYKVFTRMEGARVHMEVPL